MAVPTLESRFQSHALICEKLLGSVKNLNRLDDEEIRSFHCAKDENEALIKLDTNKLFTQQLSFYSQVLNDVLNNQEKFPRPAGPGL